MSKSSHKALLGKQLKPALSMGIRPPLVKINFVKHVRVALEQVGLPPKDYAGHSFRIGAATTYIHISDVAGLEDFAIQTLGRWESSAFKSIVPSIYIHVSSILAQCVNCSRDT